MKPAWSNGGASVRVVMTTAVPEPMRPYMREIVELKTVHNRRGHGDATAVLAAVVAEADRLQYVLLVRPDAALVDAGPTTEQLRAWYARFGFVPLPGHDAMARGLTQVV